jgi:hypothetical protein
VSCHLRVVASVVHLQVEMDEARNKMSCILDSADRFEMEVIVFLMSTGV